MRETCLWIGILGAALAMSGCPGDAGDTGQLTQVMAGPTLGGLPPLADIVEPVDTTVPPDAPVDSRNPDGKVAGSACAEDEECMDGRCFATSEGYRCAAPCAEAANCPVGHRCEAVGAGAARFCVDPDATLCRPCEGHADCASESAGDDNLCLSRGASGRFCGRSCQGDRTCPDGFRCDLDQCVPSDGVCECNPLSIALGAATECHVANDLGICAGSRFCTATGLSVCDASAPAPDICNGLDEDCNGITDDGAGAAGCGAYACAGVAGCKTRCEDESDCASGYGCDAADTDGDDVLDECVPTGADGGPCDGDEDCDSGHCGGGYCCGPSSALCCNVDEHCAALDRAPICTATAPTGCGGVQVVGRCNDHVCIEVQITTPEGCAGQPCKAGVCAGSTFEVPRQCDPAGDCVAAGANQVCADADPCTENSCSVTDGCLTAPLTGNSGVACYPYDPTTRGEGSCRDGQSLCVVGVLGPCVDAIGPEKERCNGEDDDCDGVIDDVPDTLCWPYACGGEAGCLVTCEDHDDCAPTALCDDDKCVSRGANGSPCDGDSACESGRCDNGYCCEGGTCCAEDDDCSHFEGVRCDVAAPEGCSGTEVQTTCAEDFACAAHFISTPAGCVGQPCAAASCDGNVARPAATCGEAGACVPAAAPTLCRPYACEAGACLTECHGHGDCVEGTRCRDGVCAGDGGPGEGCAQDSECASDHCDNGFCCEEGVCCGDNGDCEGLSGPGTCDNPEACEGSRVVGLCTERHECAAATIDAPDACDGAVCGSLTCTNLAAGGLVKEGVTRHLCDGAGQCREVVRDCRDLASGAYCDPNSNFYFWCDDCSPKRDTCIVLSEPCHCE